MNNYYKHHLFTVLKKTKCYTVVRYPNLSEEIYSVIIAKFYSATHWFIWQMDLNQILLSKKEHQHLHYNLPCIELNSLINYVNFEILNCAFFKGQYAVSIGSLFCESLSCFVLQGLSKWLLSITDSDKNVCFVCFCFTSVLNIFSTRRLSSIGFSHVWAWESREPTTKLIKTEIEHCL